MPTTQNPSAWPTRAPTTKRPTADPTTNRPTARPSSAPTTRRPTADPTTQKCPPQYAPSHGTLLLTNLLEHGSIAEFTCDYGYQMTGAYMILCAKGAWSDPAPTCVDKWFDLDPTCTGVERGDTSSGDLVASDSCITDGVGNYGDNEHCKIDVLRTGVLVTRGYFGTECDEQNSDDSYDQLTINGVGYSCHYAPKYVLVNPGDIVTWATSLNRHHVGWTLCHETVQLPTMAPTEKRIDNRVQLNFDWDFKNAESTAIVDSVSGIVATVTNADGWGRTAAGVDLDGVNDHLVLAFGSTQLGGPMTIEVVGKWNAFNSYSPLFDCGNGQGTDNIDIFNVGNSGLLGWRVYQANTQYYIGSGSSSDLALSVWYHIVTTVSGTTMVSYINGAKKAEKTNAVEPALMARSMCYVGKPNWRGEGHLNGAVASLKIYSGAMTQAEVTNAYSAYLGTP